MTSTRKGKCKTCLTNDALYTCPACHINSCSVLCVKQHKKDYGCSGVRNKTAFVAIKEFNESHLLSDYRFLEEVDRKSQAAHRAVNVDISQSALGIRKHVQAIATRGGIEYKLLPPGFTKTKKNKTRVIKRVIMWSVEIQFVHSGVKFLEHQVSEDKSLQEILGVYLDPLSCDAIKRQQVKLYVQAGGLEKIKVLVESRPCTDPEKRGFHHLDITKSLKENLAGKYVVEYPTLLVALEDRSDEFKIVPAEPVRQHTLAQNSQVHGNNKRKRRRRLRGRHGGKVRKEQSGSTAGSDAPKPDEKTPGK